MSTSEFTDAERFVEAYNRIDHVLRRDLPENGPRPAFSALVRESKRLTPPQREFLLDCADLRNAILHTRGSSTGRPVADPRTAAVEKLERQADLLENPPKVANVLKLQPPRVFDGQDDVAEFLQVIVERDFSQVLVRDDNGGLGLVTTNALARWFATSYEAGEGIAADSTTLANVSRHAEAEDSLRVAKRGLTVVEAWHVFAGVKSSGVPAAIVLTEDGRAEQRPMGICTRADLPALMQSLA